MKINKILYLLVLIIGLACSELHATTTVIDDHFDNGILDTAWSVSLQNATGWTYNESGTNLNVSSIVPTVVDTGAGGPWATVTLSQAFTPLTDFNVDFDFSWASSESLRPMQSVGIYLYDSIGNQISVVAYQDSWVGNRGSKYANAAGNPFFPGPNTLPVDGTASVDISRLGNNLNVLWDGTSLVSGTSSSLLSRVDLVFRYYAYNGPAGVSFFDSESIDMVKIQGEPSQEASRVPEPATMLLLGLGLMGLAGVRRKFKK
jgi:hypothetical protein